MTEPWRIDRVVTWKDPLHHPATFGAILALIAGVIACASSVIMIKASTVPPILLSGYRLLVAAVFLLPLFIRDWCRLDGKWPRTGLRRTVLPAVVLAVHFISWTIGARATAAANASLIVNLVPVTMPVFLFLSLGERPVRGEIFGTLVALGGVFLLSGGEFVAGRDTLVGDLICFGSMILFTWYLALARQNRDFPGLWLYLFPLYGLAAVICFAAAAASGGLLVAIDLREGLLLLGLGLIPTVLGHSLLNRAMTRIRGQVVSVMNVGQFIAAGLMAYLLFGEEPTGVFLLASVLVVLGALITIRSDRPRLVIRR